MKLPVENKPSFKVEKLITPWTLESVKRLQSISVISGRADNRFDPIGTATRTEEACII